MIDNARQQECPAGDNIESRKEFSVIGENIIPSSILRERVVRSNH